MVVDDLYVMGISISPGETNTPLVINSNAVLARTVSTKLLKSIGRWHPKVS